MRNRLLLIILLLFGLVEIAIDLSTLTGFTSFFEARVSEQRHRKVVLAINHTGTKR